VSEIVAANQDAAATVDQSATAARSGEAAGGPAPAKPPARTGPSTAPLRPGPTHAQRNVAVDVLRGLALVGIMMNHIFGAELPSLVWWDVHAVGFALLIGAGAAFAVPSARVPDRPGARRTAVLRAFVEEGLVELGVNGGDHRNRLAHVTPKFDAVVANPPFSYRWEPTDALGEDVRFKNHGLAPKSAADFAFLLHGFHFLKQDGVMAIILPHGVLFRGGAEARIRTKLLKDGHIDTVIGLPSNLFFSTGIPVCILVLKKCKKPDDVLFINAAEHYEKGKRQNQLLPEHIDKIIDTYQFRKEEHRYARRVSMEEIEKNDFNLNISRYVSTAEAEEEIDVAAVHSELILFVLNIKTATERHNEFLKELGLPLLPYGTSMSLPK